MARKRYTPEQIIGKLRAIEEHINAGMTAEQAARREEISVQSYCRWRKEYGGMKVAVLTMFVVPVLIIAVTEAGLQDAIE